MIGSFKSQCMGYPNKCGAISLVPTQMMTLAIFVSGSSSDAPWLRLHGLHLDATCMVLSHKPGTSEIA